MAQVMKNYCVEQLNERNYHNWKFRMEMILEENGCLENVKSETDVNTIVDEQKKNTYLKMDSKAKSLIVQCVEDSQLEYLREKDTAYKMWKTLKDKYEKKGLTGQLFLKKKLLNMKLNENESVEKFISDFDEIVRQLKSAGEEIKDQDLICNLLLSLPKSYETMVTVIENIPNVTYGDVKSKLLGEYEKRKLSGDVSGVQQSSTAFMSDKGCYRCGEVGHFKRNCKKVLSSSNTWRNQEFQRRRESTTEGRGQWGRQELNYYRGRGCDRESKPATTQRWTTNRGRGRAQSNFHRSNYVQVHQDDQGQGEGNVNNSSETVNVDKSVCFLGQTNNINDYERQNELTFFIDSGCTDHMVNKKIYFTDIVMLQEPIRIAIAKDNNYLIALGVGNIEVYSFVGNENVKCTIRNVLYVPDLRKNLLSVKRLEMHNIKVIFENACVKLVDKNVGLIGLGKRNNLYEITFQFLSAECLNVVQENNDFMKWHRRYGHIGFGGLEKLIKSNVVNGLDRNIQFPKLNFCEPCINGKMTRIPFGTRTKSNRILEIIHSDICGPITPETHDGHKYFITFIDDFSNFVIVYLLKHKNEAFEAFCEYVKMTQAMFNCNISKLRCDNGGEYTSKQFIDYCKSNGIILDYTVPYTPQQNGKAERMNRSLVERSRAMISESNVPKEFWGEAIRTVAYIMNRAITADVSDTTPAEIWYQKKPDVSNLRIFGTVVYSHVEKQFRDKFDCKTEKCVMVGYAPTGYRLWSTERNKIIISRDVKFDESKFWFKTKTVEISSNDPDINKIQDNVVANDKDEKQDEPCENDERTIETREGRRNTKIPSRYEDYELYMAFNATNFVEDVPQNYDDLYCRPDRKYWTKAIDCELKSIIENDTWETVEMPKDEKILDTKWVFSYKNLEEYEEDKYKARLVVRGFAQEEKKDFDNIYSPVAKMITIRMLLIMGNQFKYYFQQLDVKTAFLNGTLNENIYIYPPKGVKCETGKVLKLKRSLYGLKQSSKCWNDEINSYLLELGFVRSENDFCLYSKTYENEKVYLLIYVDDIILAGPNLQCINKVKEKLMYRFKMKDKGNLKNFLGLEVFYDRENGILKISQIKYIKALLKRFNMEECKTSSIPIDSKLKLDFCTDKNNNTRKPFRELVGCLMYLSLGTRPDIRYALSYFSRFQDRATDETWFYLKRVLRYLRGTDKMGLEYRRGTNKELTCYVDSDWGGDTHDRKSVTGFLFKIFNNTFMWTTRKQQCVSLSTSEAELIALCSAVSEGLWIRKLIKDFNVDIQYITFYEDNQGCIAIIKNPTNNRRVKHVDLKYNFVCENLRKGYINIVYIETNNQQADILTKGLSATLFNKFRYMLDVRDISEEGCW